MVTMSCCQGDCGGPVTVVAVTYFCVCPPFLVPHAAKIGMSMNEELESKQSGLPPNEQGQLIWTLAFVHLLFVHIVMQAIIV